MKFTITPNHIVNGERGQPMRCAMALAVRDAGLENFMGVNHTNLFTRDSDLQLCRHMLPKEATDWIIAFDTNQDVKPMSFEVVL